MYAPEMTSSKKITLDYMYDVITLAVVCARFTTKFMRACCLYGCCRQNEGKQQTNLVDM